jgi:hypothetical protein
MRLSDFKRDAYEYTRQSMLFQTVALALLAGVLAVVFLLPSEWAGVIGVAVIALALLGWRMFRTYQQHREAGELLAENRDIRAPDRLAEQRVAQGAEPYLVVGAAVETLVHSTLNTRANYLKLGWDPAHVKIIDTQLLIDSNPILAHIPGGLLPLAENDSNDTKFVLSGHSGPFKDNEDDLTLSFVRTDWQTHNTVRNSGYGVEKDNELALEFGSLDVEMNRVPSSVGLHYIVRFEDGSVLLLKRSPRIAHDPNKWSISGEEQFKVEDFAEGTLERVFRRTLCEEVVGLFDRNPGTLDRRWSEHVSDKIKTMKLWGLVFEEYACVTSCFGFYQFGISRTEFVDWHKELVDRCVGTRDNEGKLYHTTTEELDRLLRVGTCQAWRLFEHSSAPVTLDSGQLNKTSRYRAFRLVRAITGKLPSTEPQRTRILRLS